MLDQKDGRGLARARDNGPRKIEERGADAEYVLDGHSETRRTPGSRVPQ
jgi:hypothetical protein